MSDDPVKRLRDLGDRAEYMPHMHHVAADRIEELQAERDEAWRRAGHAEMMWGRAEAKLAKAVIGLKDVIGVLDDPTGDEHVRDMRAATMIARTTLAELTGGKDG